VSVSPPIHITRQLIEAVLHHTTLTHVCQPGGNVGNAIITELLKDGPRFTITGITRSTSTYKPPPPITHRTVDYTSFSSLQDAFRNQDAVVNCITGGATHYEPSKLIIDAAVAAGVKLFFANEFVGEITHEAFRRLPEAFVGGKCRIREYLEGLGKEGKMAWTSLNGGPFFDMCMLVSNYLSLSLEG